MDKTREDESEGAPAPARARDAGAPSGGAGPERRFSAPRKLAAVTRLLRGEPLETLARELNVTAARLSEWRGAGPPPRPPAAPTAWPGWRGPGASRAPRSTATGTAAMRRRAPVRARDRSGPARMPNWSATSAPGSWPRAYTVRATARPGPGCATP